MRYILSIISVVIISASGSSQFLESIRESFGSEPKIYAKIDGRDNFISSNHVKFFGVKVGLELDPRIKVGLGYNWIYGPEKRPMYQGNTLVGNKTLRYNYFSPYIEYNAVKQDPWEVIIPIQFGLGTAKEMIYHSLTEETTQSKGFVFTLEPGVLAQYRFNRFFGAGIGLGYRLVLHRGSDLITELNSPVYMGRLNVYVSEIVDAISSD